MDFEENKEYIVNGGRVCGLSGLAAENTVWLQRFKIITLYLINDHQDQRRQTCQSVLALL